MKLRLAPRIAAGARVQHAQQVGERGDAAHRRACGRHAALLLERDGGRQSVDLAHVGHAHLVEQPPSVRRDRFQVASLRLGVQRSERERRLAGARHAGEHDQCVAWDVEVDVLQVVLACASHAHEPRWASGVGLTSPAVVFAHELGGHARVQCQKAATVASAALNRAGAQRVALGYVLEGGEWGVGGDGNGPGERLRPEATTLPPPTPHQIARGGSFGPRDSGSRKLPEWTCSSSGSSARWPV